MGIGFFGATGLWLVITGAAAALLRPFLERWINARIDSGVEEGLKRRLAAHQLELDKELDRHRANLQVSAEYLRASLTREATDFAIYAQRRHDAIVGLFAELLKAEYETSYSGGVVGPDERSKPQREEEMTSRVIKARNDAYEAYYRHVLYLPPELDRLALDARNVFHDLMVEYTAPPDNFIGTIRARVRDEMRAKLERLQEAARAELSRSRTVVAPNSPIPGA